MIRILQNTDRKNTTIIIINIQEKGASVDPYVKMHLLPERKNHSKTKIARQTKDPEFNEVRIIFHRSEY